MHATFQGSNAAPSGIVGGSFHVTGSPPQPSDMAWEH
jgi:hypothetical protein